MSEDKIVITSQKDFQDFVDSPERQKILTEAQLALFDRFDYKETRREIYFPALSNMLVDFTVNSCANMMTGLHKDEIPLFSTTVINQISLGISHMASMVLKGKNND